MNPKDLSFSEQFTTDCLDSDTLVVFANMRKDWLSVSRGGLKERQISNTDQRHFQCPRNWCGAHCQYVDIGRKRLDEFFVLHPEPLLFIDDKQPKVFKCHLR